MNQAVFAPRDARQADLPAVLRLNEESVQFLSALDPVRLQLLRDQASCFRVVAQAGDVVAFLLGFREGSAYDSVNYRWFARRHPKFLYVDRIVVAKAHHGRGLGTLLYRDVFALAAARGVPLVACEIDVEPRNEASEKFHAKFGFREVGRQRVPYAPKVVAMQLADVKGPT